MMEGKQEYTDSSLALWIFRESGMGGVRDIEGESQTQNACPN